MSKGTKPKSRPKSKPQSTNKRIKHPAKKVLPPKKHWNDWWLKLPKRTQLIFVGSILAVGLAIICSTLVFHAEADQHQQAVSSFAPSIYTVAGALAQRPASTLVSTQSMLNVLRPTLGGRRKTYALNACPTATDAVMKQLHSKSIAVLLNITKTPGQHGCTLLQIVQAYGRPNASTTITGSLTNPKEVLLFYDDGPQKSGPLKTASPKKAPATVVPVTLATLPTPTCSGKTVLSFVAHQDDDLLFMSPDHLHELHGGDCLRTVYLTAGDDGMGSSYWLGRQKGAEAAYDSMAGHGSSLWIERYVTVNGHEYIKMASQRNNSHITLVFVGVPDGNISGNGFPRTHNESLTRLYTGAISKMATVDGQSSYTKNDLTNLLASLMKYYRPDEINTQTPVNMSPAHVDHSDHMTTGQFTTAAYSLYGQNVPLTYYTGYPIDRLPTNVSGQDLTDKSNAFYAYTVHDANVCKTEVACASGPYPGWLARQYTYTPGMPPIVDPSSPAPTVTDPTTSSSPPPSTPPGQ